MENTIKKGLRIYASIVRERFTEEAKNLWLVLHFDGKKIKEFTDGSKQQVERLPVVVSSPDMESPQVLGAVGLKGGSGEDILEGITTMVGLYTTSRRESLLS